MYWLPGSYKRLKELGQLGHEMVFSAHGTSLDVWEHIVGLLTAPDRTRSSHSRSSFILPVSQQ